MAKVPQSTQQAGPSPRRNPASSHYPLTTSLGHPLSPRRKAHGVKPTVKIPGKEYMGKKLMDVSLTYKKTHTPTLQARPHTLTPSLTPLCTHPPRHPPTQAPTHTLPGTYSLLTCLLTHQHVHIRTTCLTRTYTGQTCTGLTWTGLTCTGLTWTGLTGTGLTGIGQTCVRVCVCGACMCVCDIVSGCVYTCVCDIVYVCVYLCVHVCDTLSGVQFVC